MKKKLMIVTAVIIAAFALTGCGSKISYYFMSDDEYSYMFLEFGVDGYEQTLLENGAASVDLPSGYGFERFESVSEKWTVEYYLDLLITGLPGLQADFTKEKTGSDGYSVYYTYSAKRENPVEETDGDELPEGYTLKETLFYYKVSVEYDNPFNDYIKEYNSQDNSSSPVNVFKNGLFIGGDKIFPSFKEAFPLFGSGLLNDRDVPLQFYLQSDSRLYTPEGKFERDFYGTKYYLFTTALDEENGKITFDYYRANSIGWNIVTLIVGLLTVGILYLVCRKLPEKPKKITVYRTVESPFDSHNNGNDKSDKIDPFEGY